MRFRAALVAAAAALGCAAAPVEATPFAGQYQLIGSGDVTVIGADGAKWVLEVDGTESDDAAVQTRVEQTLHVTLSRCVAGACVEAGHWTRPLDASEIDVSGDRSRGLLRVAVAGSPLVLDLRNASVTIGTAFHGLGTEPTRPGARPRVSRYNFARGTLQIGRLRCAVEDGQLADVVEADTTGDDVRYPTAPPSAFPAGFLTGKRAPRC